LARYVVNVIYNMDGMVVTSNPLGMRVWQCYLSFELDFENSPGIPSALPIVYRPVLRSGIVDVVAAEIRNGLKGTTTSILPPQPVIPPMPQGHPVLPEIKEIFEITYTVGRNARCSVLVRAVASESFDPLAGCRQKTCRTFCKSHKWKRVHKKGKGIKNDMRPTQSQPQKVFHRRASSAQHAEPSAAPVSPQ
jgi:hypothetical protein